ncbi:MAG: hypothetical protein FWE15_11005 [Actinomycetia bacterium]|nr:hypothetical protein [Actinomycetes bacterium]
MGISKGAEVVSVRGEAQKVRDAGRTVFVCRIDQGVLEPGWSGSLDAVGEAIEAVEELGWRLDRSTFAGDNRGHTSAFLIFRC